MSGRRGRSRGRSTGPLDVVAFRAAARRHLERYPTTRANLRRVLVRRVDRAACEGQPRVEALGFIDQVLDELETAGLLDDRLFALLRARSLHQRGLPVMGIRLRLRREGVDPPLVDDALARLAEEEPDLDWSALVRYARRRRFGRFRTREPVGRDAERVVRRKETAAMARAGFSYALITRFFTTTGDSDEE